MRKDDERWTLKKCLQLSVAISNTTGSRVAVGASDLVHHVEMATCQGHPVPSMNQTGNVQVGGVAKPVAMGQLRTETMMPVWIYKNMYSVCKTCVHDFLLLQLYVLPLIVVTIFII